MWRVLPWIVLAVFAGCDGYTVLSGQIVDGDGGPVSGAAVRLTKDRHPVGEDQSKEDGAFEVGGVHSPSGAPLELRVRKDGFKDDLRRVPPISDPKMRIVLERDKKTKSSVLQ